MSSIADFYADGLIAKQMLIPAGFHVGKHIHDYSHLSILAKGSVKVVTGDEEIRHDAPACIEIKANILHEIIALTDTVWYCIHAESEAEKSLDSSELIIRKVG